MEKEFCYIYNPMQSDYYFQLGIVPLTTGQSSRGNYYVKFKNTKEIQEAFNKWCKRER